MLSTEQAAQLEYFLECFKKAHASWQGIEVIFTDKDFTEIGTIRRAPPNVTTLRCVLHVLKWMKDKVARLNVAKDRSHQIF